MSRRPTITDVAAAAGVSVATVSKAVNGRYGVASETVDRVLAVVAELGYESSLIASSMRSRKTGVIGVLVAGFEPFSAEILKGVGQALDDSRYDLLAYSGSHSTAEGWERRSLSRLSGTLIDGAIMVTPTVVNVGTEVPVVDRSPHRARRPAHRGVRQLRRGVPGDATPHRAGALADRLHRRPPRPAFVDRS